MLLTPAQQQQQQRPSLSYFIFLSILFFIISNNNPNSDLLLQTPEGEATVHRMRANLNKREGKRQGLARWLGLQGNQTEWEQHHGWERNATTGVWGPSNTSATVIDFHPDPNLNPVLLPTLKRLLVDSRKPNAMYHQNLTGFVRGEWETMDWSLQGLGLSETWNTTEMRRPVVVDSDSDPTEQPPQAQARVEDNPASPAVALISRRQLAPSPPALINTTLTHNRTLLRHSFPFFSTPSNKSGGKGKVSFNLREEQTSAVGAIKPLEEGRGDGELLQVVEIREEWQKVGPVTWLKVSLFLAGEVGASAELGGAILADRFALTFSDVLSCSHAQGDVTFSPQDGSDDLLLDIEGYQCVPSPSPSPSLPSSTEQPPPSQLPNPRHLLRLRHPLLHPFAPL